MLPTMTAFSANLNKIALLRNARDHSVPDLLRCAEIVVAAGADGLTVHPRPDQRHCRPGDVRDLARLAATRQVEFNVEGYPSAEFLALVEEVRPTQCTLVPDLPGQRTSDHGWDAISQHALLHSAVARLRRAGVRVSLFLDALPDQVVAAARCGAQRIELYTEPYARAYASPDQDSVLVDYRRTAVAAQAAGLGVNAGHDLTLINLGPFLRAVPGVLEVSIGHALIADALELGLGEAVRRYVAVASAAAVRLRV